MYTAEQVIEKLGLEPHYEGGWFKFVWASDIVIPEANLPEHIEGDRKSGSLIYYLLKAGEESCWHTLKSAEIWTYHYGGTLEMRLGGTGNVPVEEKKLYIGANLDKGADFQAIIPRDVWQTTKVCEGDFVLVSCVVTPAFDDSDFFMLK